MHIEGVGNNCIAEVNISLIIFSSYCQLLFRSVNNRFHDKTVMRKKNRYDCSNYTYLCVSLRDKRMIWKWKWKQKERKTQNYQLSMEN